MKKTGIFSTILIFLVLVVAGFVSWKALNEAKRSRQIEKEIESLKREAEKIRQYNGTLQGKIAYFETQDFQEREAKEKLNFQKPNESVAIVKPTPKPESINNENQINKDQPSQGVAKIPNYRKWWNKFFN